MAAEALILAIGRTTLFTSLSVLTAWLLLTRCRINSPRVHRAAWLLVVMQGWLFFPWTWQIEAPSALHMPTALQGAQVDVGSRPIMRAATPVAVVQSSEAQHSHNQATWLRSAMLAAVATWIAGAVVLCVQQSGRYLRFVHSVRNGSQTLDPRWQHEWQRSLRAARIRRRVELRTTDDQGPLLCYIPFKYLVLVPCTLWAALTQSQRRVILRHELAHLTRGDLWKSLVIRMLALPQWFNPLVWRAVRSFDEAGEWACDDLVTEGRRGRELVFARTLVQAAEYATVAAPGTLSLHGGKLSHRIRRLVSPRFKEEAMFKKMLVLLPLAGIAAVQIVRIEQVTAADAAQAANSDEAKTPSPSRWPSPSPNPDIQASASTITETAPNNATNPLPPYVIEPPDVLLITGTKVIPKTPHTIEPFDGLLIQADGGEAKRSMGIDDAYTVDPEGKVDLGPEYGQVKVVGLTVAEAETAIRQHLSQQIKNIEIAVSLAFSAGPQQIQGEHLVGPDGRVNLGRYGPIYVAGKTIDEARAAIETKLADVLEDPKVVVDIFAYNSKKYYIVMSGSGVGDTVQAVSITGNETVLDALASIGGIPQPSSAKIWIARPAPNGVGSEQILPVDWHDIAHGKSAKTNYQLLPGDRLFVETSATTDDVKVVSFSIDVIEDRENCLAEFRSFRAGAPSNVFDSELILPTIRILAKHDLIRKISSPKVMCGLGQTASVNIGGDTPIGDDDCKSKGLQLEVAAQQIGNHNLSYYDVQISDELDVLLVEFSMQCSEQQRNLDIQHSALSAPGQTIIIKADAAQADAKSKDTVPVYVVLTAELVK